MFEGFTNWGWSDTFSFSKGRHFLKVGFENRRNHAAARGNPGVGLQLRGNRDSHPQRSFLRQHDRTRVCLVPARNRLQRLLERPGNLGRTALLLGRFFQDDFKASSTLTLNLGLRWDYNASGIEVAGRMSSWNPAKLDPLSGLPGAYDFAGSCSICTGQRYFGRKDFNNFGPRFGFAWQVRPTFTIRGAYGIMYEGDDFNASTGTPHWDKGNWLAWGGTYNLAASPINPWQGLFNWDNGLPHGPVRPAFVRCLLGQQDRDSGDGRSRSTGRRRISSSGTSTSKRRLAGSSCWTSVISAPRAPRYEMATANV